MHANMHALYQSDLANVHAAAFGGLAQGAAAEIVRRLRNSSAPIRSVLDVGCGAGPLTKALSDAGFDVTGMDISGELLHIARAHVPTAHFVEASAYEAEIRGYDAVVVVGEPLTYHADAAHANNLIGDFFRRVAGALPSGGMLIFDVIALGQPARSWITGADWAVLVETTENQAEHTLIRYIETFRRVGELYRRSNEVHTVRLFDIRILRDQLASCCFAVETAQSYGVQQLPPRRHAIFATRRSCGPESRPDS